MCGSRRPARGNRQTTALNQMRIGVAETSALVASHFCSLNPRTPTRLTRITCVYSDVGVQARRHDRGARPPRTARVGDVELDRSRIVPGPTRRIVQQDPTRAQLLLLVKRSAVFRRLPADRGTSPDVPSQPTHPRFITRLAVWDGTPALGSDQLERLAPPRACARGLSPASRPGARPPRFHHEGKHLEALASNIG